MASELLGFAAGVSLIVAIGALLVGHQRWKQIAAANGREPTSRRGRNALIWPSR